MITETIQAILNCQPPSQLTFKEASFITLLYNCNAFVVASLQK